ncbi:hypothetical protein OSB04_016011 [Centaurea solstitialis]|uniref:Protein TIC 21, chloroplastic n=1 Tax=Centaurea solstitialis TaxID=347529 RepID=A0AA38TB76_9ASTR|nr:hypothetical protein OSB04_016011 [Centaurea solstitialis]
MQTLLLPAGARTGIAPPSLAAGKPLSSAINFLTFPSSSSSSSSSQFSIHSYRRHIGKPNKLTYSPPPISASYASSSYEYDKPKLSQVSKKLESSSRYFKRLGSLGFWGQLTCTTVAAAILSFSVVITGKISSPVTFYSTSGGIAAAFLSVFWSFGYIRLSDRLRKTANNPSKAPPRGDVIKSLKNGIVLNLLGMGAAILGMQATVGTLVAKALTTSVNPSYRSGSNPILALDVFLVQASANTILSHFLGLAFSLELLRSVTKPPSESIQVPKVT